MSAIGTFVEATVGETLMSVPMLLQQGSALIVLSMVIADLPSNPRGIIDTLYSKSMDGAVMFPVTAVIAVSNGAMVGFGNAPYPLPIALYASFTGGIGLTASSIFVFDKLMVAFGQLHYSTDQIWAHVVTGSLIAGTSAAAFSGLAKALTMGQYL